MIYDKRKNRKYDDMIYEMMIWYMMKERKKKNMMIWYMKWYERRENRSVQFREVNGELEEGKSEDWIPNNYQTASVGNRDLGQLLEKALQESKEKYDDMIYEMIIYI